MVEIPPGYRIYGEILSRMGVQFRPQGSGLSFVCPFRENHTKTRLNAFVRIGRQGELVSRCLGCGAGWREFVALVGLPTEGWWPNSLRRSHGMENKVASKVVAEYHYTDRNGEPLAIKQRWEPGFDGGKKSFSWRRPVVDECREYLNAQGIPEGHSIWAIGSGALGGGEFRGIAKDRAKGPWWFRHVLDQKCPQTGPQVQLPPVQLSIFRCAEIQRANAKVPIIVVEGEKDVMALEDLGFQATTGYAGHGKWEYHWGSVFAGRRVVVIPDRDPKDIAMDYGHKIVASAIYYRAASVRLVELPITELKPNHAGGDISDWLDFHFPRHDKQQRNKSAAKQKLIELVTQFPEYSSKGAKS